MSKLGRRLKVRDDEIRHSQRGGGPEREGSTHRPFDPNYRNCPFDQATFSEQLARLYHPDTIDHLAITRKSISNGDGHLPQPVHIESSPSQQVLRELLEGAERTLIPLDAASNDQVPTNQEAPRVRRVGNTTFIE